VGAPLTLSVGVRSWVRSPALQHPATGRERQLACGGACRRGSTYWSTCPSGARIRRKMALGGHGRATFPASPTGPATERPASELTRAREPMHALTSRVLQNRIAAAPAETTDAQPDAPPCGVFACAGRAPTGQRRAATMFAWRGGTQKNADRGFPIGVRGVPRHTGMNLRAPWCGQRPAGLSVARHQPSRCG
jgi:hypothetical protein